MDRERRPSRRFGRHLKAMIKKNLLIKCRQKKCTLAEILLPVYAFAILLFMGPTLPNPHFHKETVPREDIKCHSCIHDHHFQDDTIAVAPDTTEIQVFLQLLNKIHENLPNSQDRDHPINFVYYNSKEKMIDDYWKDPHSTGLAIVFENNPYDIDLRYEIKTNPSFIATPVTHQLYAPASACRQHYHPNDPMTYKDQSHTIQAQDECPAKTYVTSGFLSIQQLIDLTKMKMELKNDSLFDYPRMSVELFPKEEFTAKWILVYKIVFPFYISMALTQFITYLLILIVGEKEKRIKEGMKIMGVKDSVYWTAWFIPYAAIVLLISIIATIMLYAVRLFQHSDCFLVFLLLDLYGVTIILFAFLLTAFFDKSRTAGFFGSFASNIPSLLYFIPSYIVGASGNLYFWVMSLVNSAAFALAMDKALMLELDGVGVQFHNLWEGDGLTFGHSLLALAIDIMFYALLAYYLDNVIPSSYGTKRSSFFFLKWQYWFPRSREKKQDGDENGFGMTSEELENEDIEPVPETMRGKCAIRITNLHKTFYSCRKQHNAINCLNLTIYEGQITAILGQNGAGKTTLFNILTGLTSPTKGTAHIFGMDIRNAENMENIRSMTGVCPQHDILFDLLTPREHLHFYATIRNVPQSLIDTEVDKTLTEIDLLDRSESAAKVLSGGQRRKLSVGIAVIGDPKIIILDEPTAAVDPYSRRRLWSLLQSKKQGKVILLTTHFMDEADILADRKAVISKGKLRCCGSSLFLKSKFGIGYHLTLVLEDNTEEEMCTELVLNHVPSATLARHHGKELSYVLPHDSVHCFAPLFLEIEENVGNEASNLHISSYGVSMTTLEEVFIQLGKDEEYNSDDDDDDDNLSKNMVNGAQISLSDSDDAKKSLSHSESVVSGSGVSLDHLVKPKSVNRSKSSLVSDGKSDVIGINFEASNISPDYKKIFIALVKLRAKRLMRDPYRLILMLLAPIMFANLGFSTLAMQGFVSKATPLKLDSETYTGINGKIALHGESDALKDLLDVKTEYYDGQYPTLLDVAPHMAALDIFSCCDLKDAEYTVLYNDTTQHSLPIIVNIMNNALYKKILGEKRKGKIEVKSHPFPTEIRDLDSSPIMVLASMSLGAVILLMPVSLCIDVVHDRETKARNQLRVSGLSFFFYYFTYFWFFGCIMSFVTAIVLGTAFFYNVPSINGYPSMFMLILLIGFYTPAALLFVACVTYIFEKADTAHSFMYNMFFILASSISIEQYFSGSSLVFQLHTLFSFISTTYLPFSIIYYVNKVYRMCHADVSCTELTIYSYMDYEILMMFVGIVTQIVGWCYVLFVLDLREGGNQNQSFCPQLAEAEDPIEQSYATDSSSSQYDMDGDDDVRIEEDRVARGVTSPGQESPVIMVQNLRKEYLETLYCSSGEDAVVTVAVGNLSVAVESGEVLGLLGHNGAGKTTTLKIITSEESATRGKVEVKGMNTNLNSRKVFKHIGYCPQKDTQWNNVTVREHLELYATIRGVPEKEIPMLVDSYLKGLKMKSHADKESQYCSGGTRRKLSFAIAMIGDPSVILLDEPSTGMDPSSKRFLWDSILASFKGKKGAILSTHLMDEADALCSRVGIMMYGNLKCIGSIQHLKNLYGAGYSLEVKLKNAKNITATVAERHDLLKIFVFDLFSQANLEECFEERLIFRIPQAGVASLAESFRQLEQAKIELDIEEYSFSQTTLEQVFLRFSHSSNSKNQFVSINP
ncbi:ATP-binding cassette sub-family A member 2 [Nilaparvata lugens]|uniref:ATP-binding cassette sub-family A member 2 n=1 Tax=Nilaparvata lugens TaxID=108931 RepID=UPI00193E0DD4|nr:ATP-binding cassette sub-family A member 2 [Nilaparvata lugens]